MNKKMEKQTMKGYKALVLVVACFPIEDRPIPHTAQYFFDMVKRQIPRNYADFDVTVDDLKRGMSILKEGKQLKDLGFIEIIEGMNCKMKETINEEVGAYGKQIRILKNLPLSASGCGKAFRLSETVKLYTSMLLEAHNGITSDEEAFAAQGTAFFLPNMRQNITEHNPNRDSDGKFTKKIPSAPPLSLPATTRAMRAGRAHAHQVHEEFIQSPQAVSRAENLMCVTNSGTNDGHNASPFSSSISFETKIDGACENLAQ